MPSTRPNITFDEKGVCSACQWTELKKTINWQERQDYFAELCNKFRKIGLVGDAGDVIVPFSGGKDSVYVAYKMRGFGMIPLLVTVLPDLEAEIGAWNRKNLCPDFKRIEIKLSDAKYRNQARECFIDNGKVKHPWENAISAVVLQQAAKENIPFVVYGEEGGAEYGGYGGWDRALNYWKEPIDNQYLREYYFLNKELFDLPSEYSSMFFTQWSRFENWQPTKHADFAVAKGMRTIPTRSIGTFTCDSQISDKLQDLHTYILFIKFGFGRATADSCIAIRDGQWDRDTCLEFVEAYDGDVFPNDYLQQYLEYLRMTKKEFDEVLFKHANKELVEQMSLCGTPFGHVWYLKSWIAKKRRQGTSLEFISPNRWNYDKRRSW
jgi:N-acetyl sugar amidotransferase